MSISGGYTILMCSHSYLSLYGCTMCVQWLYTHVYVWVLYVCVFVCMHMGRYQLWLCSSVTPWFIFWDEISCWPWDHQFIWTGWLLSSSDPPVVSVSPALGWQGHTTEHGGVYLDAEGTNSKVCQPPPWLSHLSNLTLSWFCSLYLTFNVSGILV